MLALPALLIALMVEGSSPRGRSQELQGRLGLRGKKLPPMEARLRWAGRQYGEAVERHLRKMLKRYIEHPQPGVPALIPWFARETSRGNTFALPAAYSDIIDWALATSPNLEPMALYEAMDASLAWHTSLTALQLARSELEAGTELIYEFGDGWQMRMLTSAAALRREGDAMGHCIGSNPGYWSNIEGQTALAVSLRDPSGQPRVTTYLRKARSFEHPYKIDGEQVYVWNIVESRAKSNARPPKRHTRRIFQWMADSHNQLLGTAYLVNPHTHPMVLGGEPDFLWMFGPERIWQAWVGAGHGMFRADQETGWPADNIRQALVTPFLRGLDGEIQEHLVNISLDGHHPFCKGIFISRNVDEAPWHVDPTPEERRILLAEGYTDGGEGEADPARRVRMRIQRTYRLAVFLPLNSGYKSTVSGAHPRLSVNTHYRRSLSVQTLDKSQSASIVIVEEDTLRELPGGPEEWAPKLLSLIASISTDGLEKHIESLEGILFMAGSRDIVHLTGSEEAIQAHHDAWMRALETLPER